MLFLTRAVLAGAPVLELGSGTGLVGLAAALCGAQAILTDTHEVVPSLAANVAANAVVSLGPSPGHAYNPRSSKQNSAGWGSKTCLLYLDKAKYCKLQSSPTLHELGT